MQAYLAPVIGGSIIGLIVTVAIGLMMSDQGKWPGYIDWLIALFVVVLILAIGTRSAPAHEAPAGWPYPLSCCSNYDCKQVGSGAVLERPEGFVIAETGETIPMTDKRVRQSPDGAFHWCAHQAGDDRGKTICLFAPPRGF